MKRSEIDAIVSTRGNHRLDSEAVVTDTQIPAVPRLFSKILKRIERGAGNLDMNWWHGNADEEESDRDDEDGYCGTTHCLAGWAVTLGGRAGKSLEKRCGSDAAGALIFQKSVGYIPDFGSSDETALAVMVAGAADESERS